MFDYNDDVMRFRRRKLMEQMKNNNSIFFIVLMETKWRRKTTLRMNERS